ncbi:MAG: type 4a pilus biogenesis protein PilO [bacterium]|nr:type 4a pilus biogenesis protein PilO [bacterium]
MDVNVESIKAGYFKLPEYQKILVSLSVVLVVAGLYVYLIYMPMLESMGVLERKLSDLQTKVSQVRAVADELPKFEEEHNKVKERLAKALTQLPGSDEIPKLLKDMETLGNAAGVEQ